MARISGVVLPNNKRVEIALTYVYGLGLKTSQMVLDAAQIDPNLRVSKLTDQQVQSIQQTINDNPKIQVEGDRQQLVFTNIKHLRDIQSYRGKRHQAKLPTRGQRTRTNARTRRGKRLAVGGTAKKAPTKT